MPHRSDHLELLRLRLIHADEWRLGLFGCSRCDQSWTDDLPPLWWSEWPTCPVCQAPALLIEALAAEA